MKLWTQQEIGELTEIITKYKVIPKNVSESFSKKFCRSKNAVRQKAVELRKKYKIVSNYTEDDEDVIRKCIKKYPYNITLALSDAAACLGRSFYGVSQYYYSNIAKKRSKSNTLFALFNDKLFLQNKKVVARKGGIIPRVRTHKQSSIIEKIKRFLS